jgi:hypothetical protein
MRFQSVLRVVAGVALVWVGTMHLVGASPMPAAAGTAAPMPQLWIAAVLAVFGGTAALLDAVVTRLTVGTAS